MKRFYFQITLILTLLFSFNTNAQNWTETHNCGRYANTGFGFSVAISGDTAIVGAPLASGGWEVGGCGFFISGSGCGFGGGGFGGGGFGGGAFGDDDAPNESGAAYVFIRSGTSWILHAKLTACDAASGDRFGTSVSISGNTVIIGAPGDGDAGSSSGSAYVFAGSGTIWSQQAKLTANDAAANDGFGRSVSISGNTVIIGAPGDGDAGSNSGSAYVFAGSGSSWSQQVKLTANDAAASDLFGISVSISGNTVIIGAPGDGDVGVAGSNPVFRSIL